MRQLLKHTEPHANSLLWVGGCTALRNHAGASLHTWQAAAHCLLLLQLPPAVVLRKVRTWLCSSGSPNTRSWKRAAPVDQASSVGGWDVPSTVGTS